MATAYLKVSITDEVRVEEEDTDELALYKMMREACP